MKVGLADIYSMLLDIDRRLAKIETHQPLTNGHARVSNLESVETDHETRLRRLETSVTVSDGVAKDRERLDDNSRANLALIVAGLAFVAGIVRDLLSAILQ